MVLTFMPKAVLSSEPKLFNGLFLSRHSVLHLVIHVTGENNRKCEEAFKEMTETGRDILIQEAGGHI